MCETGRYSYDGKSIIKLISGKTYEVIPDKQKNREENQIHSFVAKQFLLKNICKEIKAKGKSNG